MRWNYESYEDREKFAKNVDERNKRANIVKGNINVNISSQTLYCNNCRRYVVARGTSYLKCPRCGSSNLSGSPMERSVTEKDKHAGTNYFLKSRSDGKSWFDDVFEPKARSQSQGGRQEQYQHQNQRPITFAQNLQLIKWSFLLFVLPCSIIYAYLVYGLVTLILASIVIAVLCFVGYYVYLRLKFKLIALSRKYSNPRQ